jgi:oleate hydratase
MAAGAIMIRDAAMERKNILILEADARLGGSLDAVRSATDGYSMRGGRMFTTDHYECTWDLVKTSPSLSSPGTTVYDEALAFNDLHKSDAKARLVTRQRAKVPVRSMGFSMRDRAELSRLMAAEQITLAGSRITDWLSPSFFETPTPCSPSSTR